MAGIEGPLTVSRMNDWMKSSSINSHGITNEGMSSNKDSSASDVQRSFSSTLEQAIHAVNDLQKKADHAAQELAVGRTDNVADVMIAAEKADIALKMMVQVRNKIIDAYQEVMKMQV